MVSRAPTIGRRVLREEVKEYLIELIRRGELKPGDRVVETHVAQQLGVSQTPVREALRDLELFGFVVSSPFRGTRVREVSTTDLIEIYAIRAALEGVAARQTAPRITEPALAELATLLDRMREAAVRDDRYALVEADIAFHRIIVEASGNRLLRQFWESMSLSTSTFLTVVMSRHNLDELAARHEPLLAALRTGDPALAEAAMRRHIEEPGEWILAAAEASDGQPKLLAREAIEQDGAREEHTWRER